MGTTMCVGAHQGGLHHGQPSLPQAGGEESAGISSLVSSHLISKTLPVIILLFLLLHFIVNKQTLQ